MILATISTALLCSAFSAYMAYRLTRDTCEMRFRDMTRGTWKVKWHPVTEAMPKCGKLLLVAYTPTRGGGKTPCVSFTRRQPDGFELEKAGLGQVVAWAANPRYMPSEESNNENSRRDPVRASGTGHV